MDDDIASGKRWSVWALVCCWNLGWLAGEGVRVYVTLKQHLLVNWYDIYLPIQSETIFIIVKGIQVVLLLFDLRVIHLEPFYCTPYLLSICCCPPQLAKVGGEFIYAEVRYLSVDPNVWGFTVWWWWNILLYAKTWISSTTEDISLSAIPDSTYGVLNSRCDHTRPKPMYWTHCGKSISN